MLDINSIASIQETFNKADKVIITSSIAPAKSIEDIEKNIQMINNLSLLFKDNFVKHVVLLSSDSVYGEKSNLFNENSPLSPDTFHGLSQLNREFILKQIPLENLAVLRCTSIYGYSDTHNSYGPNRFVREALSANEINIFGKGLNKRDNIFIEEVVNIIYLILLHDFSGVLNIASGNSLTFLQMATAIAEVFNPNCKIKFNGNEGEIISKNFDVTKLISVFPQFVADNFDRNLIKWRNYIL